MKRSEHLKQALPDILPDIWVVFSGQADLPWLKILKPGFRHCYAVMNDGQRWIVFDPLSHCTEVSVPELPAYFDLPLWLEDRGLKVIKAPVQRIQKQAPWMPFSCVEAVKRLIGLHSFFIFTPWQLYKFLLRHEMGHDPHIDNDKGDLVWEV